MAMVTKANKNTPGIGGHISTYASAATLYEVAFNHVFKGPNHKEGQDLIFFLFLMFIGGCAGSTTGGIKIFRLQILFRGAITQIRKLTQPHAVLIMRFNGKSVNENTYNSIMGFFFMYIFLFILSAVSLSLFNLDFLTAFSAAASAISNVGPGLGEMIGPSGNYFLLDNGAKWILSLTMIIGRLEIFTVLVLLSINFWRS